MVGKVSSDRLMAAVHGSLDQGGGGKANGKYLNSRCIVKEYPTESADRLDVLCGRKR